MVAGHVIVDWNPEDRGFWQRQGCRIARRNLWLSVPALVLSFAVWMVWSAVVVQLPQAGFRYSTNQLFWLAALPALCGATLRLFYAFGVTLVGGRRWTALATASLLLPAVGIGLAVQRPDTPFEAMVGLSLLCGLGGGNFASAVAHVGWFFPGDRKGAALGLLAGLGQLGVTLVQLAVPLAVAAELFGGLGGLGGAPHVGADGAPVWLQNAGFVWVPFIAASALAAWFGLDDIAAARGRFAEQVVIFTRRHTWRMSWLYLGSFGSVIGFAAGLPLLLQSQFPQADALQVAWLGPLVAALARPPGGWLADRLGGARVTLWCFAVLALGVLALPQFLPHGGAGGHLGGVVACSLLLFAAAGTANGSSFRMIPAICLAERRRAAPAAARALAEQDANREAAAALGFASAIGAYGGFFIPKSYGTAIALTGSAEPALLVFVAFYLSCIALTWWHYARPGAPMPC